MPVNPLASLKRGENKHLFLEPQDAEPALKRVIETLNCRVAVRENGCWEWLGALRNGYGLISYDSKTTLVSRLALHIHIGFNLNSELHVLHRCDNPKCFNPEHLFTGTQSDNIIDCNLKGRRPKHNVSLSHCRKGHEYNNENTYTSKTGKHYCRICDRVRRKNQKVS